MIPPEDLEVSTYPPRQQGGQQVGIGSTGVRIEHKPTGLVAICVSSRSSHANKAVAMEMIEAALTSPRFRM